MKCVNFFLRRAHLESFKKDATNTAAFINFVIKLQFYVNGKDIMVSMTYVRICWNLVEVKKIRLKNFTITFMPKVGKGSRLQFRIGNILLVRKHQYLKNLSVGIYRL